MKWLLSLARGWGFERQPRKKSPTLPIVRHGTIAGASAVPTVPAHLVHPQYRPDIDGLRALGVLLVVAFHAYPKALPGGYVGVDIFFVVSGYLISTIIFGSLEQGSFSFSEFYARRIRRIFPALTIVLVATWGLGWYLLLVDEHQRLGIHIAGGAGFVSNFVLWGEAGYFDSDAYAKPLLHLWSLGIEEQFYIIWPLLLALLWRREADFLRITLVIAIVSFAANVLSIKADMTAAFYAPWTRFWELMSGGILAYLSLHGRGQLLRSASRQAAIGGVLILIAVAVLNKKSTFPGWWALLPTLGTFLIIGAGPDAWLNRTLLSSRGMVGIGLISYPLYLWHWLLLSFAWIAKGRMPPSGVRAALVGASFALAYLTYRFVEKPIRAGSRRSALILLAVMSTLLVLGIVTDAAPLRSRHDEKSIGPMLEALRDWEYPSGLERTTFKETAVKSRMAAGPAVLFVGDSHLEQYSPRIVHLLDRGLAHRKSVIFLTSPGCSPIPGSAQINPYAAERCPAFRVEVEKLAADPGIGVIVVGGAWNLYFLDSSSHFAGDVDVESEFAGIARFLSRVAANKKVYFVLDNPSGQQFQPRNFFAGSRLTTLTAKPFQETIPLDDKQAALRDRLAKLATEAGATVIDPVAAICPRDQCRAFTTEGKPIYKDDHHYRASYARKHMDFIDITLVE